MEYTISSSAAQRTIVVGTKVIEDSILASWPDWSKKTAIFTEEGMNPKRKATSQQVHKNTDNFVTTTAMAIASVVI